MKHLLLSIFVLSCFLGFSQQTENTIKGKVTDEQNVALSGVHVTVKEKDKGTYTDANGNYKISAAPNEILVFSFTGKNSVQVLVQDVTTTLYIQLKDAVEELEEVVVTKRKIRQTQKQLSIAYSTDSTIVRTPLGYLSPKTVFYEFYTLSTGDLEGYFDILDAIYGKIAGARIKKDLYGQRHIHLSGNNTPATFMVDGNVLPIPPDNLNLEDILRVGIMYSNEAILRFGRRIGAGGIIFVNTKFTLQGAREGDTNLPYDQAKLRSNVYANNAISVESIQKSQAAYLSEFENSTDFESSKLVYQKFEKNYKNLPFFYIDAYAHFMKIGQSKFANQQIEEQMHLFENHPVYAKALAYQYDFFNDAKRANTLYEEIFKLRPNYIQSYRDLAESYRELGSYKKAAAMYARHNYLLEEGLIKTDTTGIQLLMERESDNLVGLQGEEIVKSSKLPRSKKFLDFNGARLLFEWNDSEAEFELKFVNPLSHFYAWEHTSEANQERIWNEKTLGYSCQEFLMDGSLPGKWLVNINYKGNKTTEPTYLKVTIFNHYGDEIQGKQVKVYRLSLKNNEQQLFTMSNMGKLVSN